MKDLSLYNAVKDKIQTGDLINIKSNTMLGASIRFMSRKERRQYEIDHDINVNHSMGVLRLPLLEEDHRFIPESLEDGPVLHILSERLDLLDGEAWWYHVPATDEERLEWGRETLKWIGKGVKYGYKDIVKYMFSQPDINPENGLICSEFWLIGWKYKGKTLSPNGLPALDLFNDVLPVRIL